MLILYWVLVAVMAVGVVGALIPGIPGPSIVLAAIIIWGIVTSFQQVLWALVAAIVILVFCFGVDLLAGYLGAKHAGASKWGQIGAVVGMIVGLIGVIPLPVVGILGLLIWPLIGAVIGEFIYCKDWKQSLKAGVGIVVGSVVGNIIQGVLTVVPLVIFIWTTWSQLGAL